MDISASHSANGLTSVPATVDAKFDERAVANKLASAAMWDIVQIFMRTPGYSNLTLADLRWALIPAVINRQYTLIHINDAATGLTRPAGVVFWARVADNIDAQWRANPGHPMRLDAAQRNSGAHHWITDAAGDPDVVAVAIAKLKAEIAGDEAMSALRFSEVAGWHVAGV